MRPAAIIGSSFSKAPLASKATSSVNLASTMATKATNVPTTTTGAFARPASGYRNMIEKGSRFEPEAGRYHLYVALGCPWASRAAAMYYAKGLENVIGLSITHAVRHFTRPGDPSTSGWMFTAPTDPPITASDGIGAFSCEGSIPDTVNGCKFVRELYELSKDKAEGRFTVPVLWDKKEGTIVNNESPDIMRIFNNAFNDLCSNPSLDLCPKELLPKIDEINEYMYNSINNGVYRAGFATSQAAYDEAVKILFVALDGCEEILSKQRYMVGDVMTESDVKLFKTLIRFDQVYYLHFKCNKKRIQDYPNLSNFTKEMYAVPWLQKAVNMRDIKWTYYLGQRHINTHGIVPIGGEFWWEQPHDRESKFPAKL